MKREADIFGVITEAQKRGQGMALATVVSTHKSSPRKAGAKMVIFAGGATAGTVGGGVLEALVIREARKALAEGASRKVVYSLDPENPDNITMCCGGEMEIFIDVLKHEAPLIIFGGGHVGEKIAHLAEAIGMPYSIVDDRAEYANRERFPMAADVIARPYREAFGSPPITEESFLVICTRGHEHDLTCVREALGTKARYIGLIASRNKAATFMERLAAEGIAVDERVYSPIGLDLGDSSPGQIALSVLAEIIKLKSGGTGEHKRRTPLEKMKRIE